MSRKNFYKKELKGPSLTIKWAAASSFFIFVVFTIFAVITYKSAINLIVEKERKNVEEIILEVDDHLAKVKNRFTLYTVYEALKTPSNPKSDLYTKKKYAKGSLLEVDALLARIGQKELFLSIYDTQENLIFRTQEEQPKLLKREEEPPMIMTIKDKTGFFSIHPVYAEKNKKKLGYIQVFYDLTSFYEIRSKLLLTLIILEIISLILSSILGFLLSSYFLKPVKVLRDTMDVIRNNPQSVIHVPEIHSDDELADLAEIFNEMLDRMRRYVQLQEQFVEDASHELRTPVAIIEGHLNMLNRWGKEDPELLDESIKASLQEIIRMKSLVQEMLDLSRAEQVDVNYKNERSHAKEVVYQVYNNIQLLYPEFVITLEDKLSEELSLKIYRNHFEQLLIILLDNAVKYSTDRKEIQLYLSRIDDEVKISVQDFGEGIAKAEIDNIFGRFYRIDKARSRNKGGNGLGLSIAKQLVENYKGRIEVESAVGKGTTFTIYLLIDKEHNG